jgi:hypothetical protein
MTMTRNAAALLLAALAGLAPAQGQAAKAYKWTDDAGNVHYSDSPRPGAEVIDLPTEPAGIVPLPPDQVPKRPAPSSLYGTLILASPTEGQIVQDPTGWVNVSLAVEPPLRVSQGDAIRLRLDGQTLDTRYTGAEIAIPGVPRGAHTLQVEVVNPAGKVLISSGSVTFYVQEPSALAPAGPDVYPQLLPGQPYPPTYRPVYPPQPYPPQGRPKPQ